MADTLTTAVTGLASGLASAILVYLGTRVQAGAQEKAAQSQGSASVQVARIEADTASETHLWEYVQRQGEEIRELFDRWQQAEAARTKSEAERAKIEAELVARTVECDRLQNELRKWREGHVPVVLPARLQAEIMAEAHRHTGKTYRVLAVEDNADIAALLPRVLESESVALSLAYDGLEAWHLYQAACQGPQPFDALLMDYAVPGKDGGQLCEAVRAAGDDKTLLILYTAHAEMVSPALIERVRAHLWPKTFPASEMSAELGRLLKDAESRRETRSD